MSIESKLWMGNVEKSMNEEKIMKYFNEYNFYPESIHMIKDKKLNCLCEYCFVQFSNMNEANDALVALNGKKIPNTSSTFKLKWANPKSDNINIYVYNLSPEIDNIELFNLFIGKYQSVHHASIITNNNVSKGYGIINFLDKKDYEKCLKEMDGYIFHNKPLKVKEIIIRKNKINNYKKKNSKEEGEEEKVIESDDYNLNSINILKGHNGPVTFVVCSENEKGAPILFSASTDLSIIKWKLYIKDDKYKQKKKSIFGEPDKIIKEHHNLITSLFLNFNHTKLISSSLDKTIKLWDINTLNPELIINNSQSEILSACIKADDKTIICGDKNAKLKYYNTDGKLIYCDNTIKRYVTCFLNFCFSGLKRKNYTAVGFSDGIVRIYDNDNCLIKEIPIYGRNKSNDKFELKEEEQYSVVSLSCDEDGEFLFIGYRNGTIIIFHFEEFGDGVEENVTKIIENEGELNDVLYESKFFSVVFIGTNKGLIVRSLKPDKIVYKDKAGPCLSLCFDKNKNYLFAGYEEGIIKIYHVSKKEGY